MNSREVTNALARHFDYRRNVIVPRCHFAGAEADLLVLRPSNWLEEIEIKVSVADFKREFETKADKHLRLVRGTPPCLWGEGLANARAERHELEPVGRGGSAFDWTVAKEHKIRKFWFAVPIEIFEKVQPLVPEHAGLMTVSRVPRSHLSRHMVDIVAIAKPAPALKMSRKLTLPERCDLCWLAYLRFWDVEAKEEVAEPVPA